MHHADTLAFLGALIVAGLPPAALAQNDPLLRPPRIERRADPPGEPAQAPAVAAPTRGPTPPPILGSLRPPNAATLAPLPEDRAGKPDEIIVIGRGWRLPDLGSEWRKKQEEADDTGRFHVTFMPLYDPNRPPLRSDIMLATPEWQRHGYIELFRMRFGRRGAPEPQE
ncbi:MAG TPA: hypothetical protein VHH11_05660 [Gammaproteobacteria bacterium]|jgi:hypothetical protein|nr:hypothetical protein [Gammaproteobacteria bacterium]